MLSLKTDVNLPTLRNKQKNLEKQLIFCWDLENHCQKGAGSGSEAGSVIRSADPRIRIRIKMSRIRNTD
jgi:hypothetical protein